MLARFFPAIGQPLNANLYEERSRKILLAAPTKSGRTSLLFQYSLSLAEEDKYVLFISPTQPDKIPLLSEGKEPPTAKLLKYITMVYPKNLQQLLQFLSSAHTVERNIPYAVIIDDLDTYYIDKNKTAQKNAIKATICSYLYDVVEFYSSKLTSKPETSRNVSCHLIAAINSSSFSTKDVKDDKDNKIMQEWFYPTLLVTSTNTLKALNMLEI
ncbi:uncharacterized protein TRIADDRAFT_54317 [Trichoplax adhaerens]|uniref:AAA+ ATPase domain-containing protein n=1 Tax=Trichoplax adhaerens TaxID=10228 RepID=B3RRP6_TRIAD|nr:hypothetical protein TRIADDRAFT_54317 [Trichoplax adhaerens]EDV26388.1 hypothetical protein TRIADDRAFT_54317 [Trichoplax adhaerens]|eukprot:XP_002110384.1 hypothetical protein TRIADDRAFT_54317 [Trichoplax adhaerens]